MAKDFDSKLLKNVLDEINRLNNTLVDLETYKDILTKKLGNYSKIFKIIEKAKELVEEKHKLMADLAPSRGNNDKLVEELRKQINTNNTEKNKIKEKRKEEEKSLKNYEKEKEENVNKLNQIFFPFKESI